MNYCCQCLPRIITFGTLVVVGQKLSQPQPPFVFPEGMENSRRSPKFCIKFFWKSISSLRTKFDIILHSGYSTLVGFSLKSASSHPDPTDIGSRFSPHLYNGLEQRGRLTIARVLVKF